MTNYDVENLEGEAKGIADAIMQNPAMRADELYKMGFSRGVVRELGGFRRIRGKVIDVLCERRREQEFLESVHDYLRDGFGGECELKTAPEGRPGAKENEAYRKMNRFLRSYAFDVYCGRRVFDEPVHLTPDERLLRSVFNEYQVIPALIGSMGDYIDRHPDDVEKPDFMNSVLGEGKGIAGYLFSKKLALEDAFASLTQRERRILRLRFGYDEGAKTLKEVGNAFGVSGQRIRQIEDKAIRKLRQAMKGADTGLVQILDSWHS